MCVAGNKPTVPRKSVERTILAWCGFIFFSLSVSVARRGSLAVHYLHPLHPAPPHPPHAPHSIEASWLISAASRFSLANLFAKRSCW